jgi:threonine synthase
LADFIRTGVYDRRRPFYLTDSPSMDILVSSNLERLLFLLSEGDSLTVAQWMKALKEEGVYQVPEALLAKLQESFVGFEADDEKSAAVLGEIYEKYGYLADPHTAVAFSAAKEYKEKAKSANPMVILSTASPFKFSRPVLRAIGADGEGDEFDLLNRLSALTGIPVPKSLAELASLPERHLEIIEKEAMADFVLSKIADEKA